MNCSVGVRAQRRNTSFLESFEELWARMAVGIFFTCGDHGEVGLHGGEKIRSSGILATVMADF